MARRTRRFWGWGYEDHSIPGPTLAFAEASLTGLLGKTLTRRAPPRVEDIAIPKLRFMPPAELLATASVDPSERLNHAMGKSSRDVARAIRGRFPHVPDVVGFPKDEAEVVRTSGLRAVEMARMSARPFNEGWETWTPADTADIPSLPSGWDQP